MDSGFNKLNDTVMNTEEHSQYHDAVEIINSVIDLLEDTRDEASELNKLEICTLAEKSGEIIFKGLDDIKNKLLDLAKQYKSHAITNHIKNSMSPAPRSSSVY